jgi:hypothetical protein
VLSLRRALGERDYGLRVSGLQVEDERQMPHTKEW